MGTELHRHENRRDELTRYGRPSESHKVGWKTFNPKDLVKYREDRVSKRKDITDEDLDKYSDVIEEAQMRRAQEWQSDCCLFPMQMTAFHNVMGAAVQRTRRELGIRRAAKVSLLPANKPPQKKRRKSNSRKELLLKIFDGLIALGKEQRTKFGEHTSLSEKFRGALVFLDDAAFQSFFVLLIRILSRELLVDKKVMVDRRHCLMKLLCNKALRLSFANTLHNFGAVTEEVSFVHALCVCVLLSQVTKQKKK